jgi:hypothetical protein
MPYKSQAQAAYFNTHRKELEKQGVDVGEWNAASNGMDLPKKAGSREQAKARFKAAAAKRSK